MADFQATVYQDTAPVLHPLATLYPNGPFDPLLIEAGVVSRGRYDPGFSLSYPGGPVTGRAAPANPANAAVLYDVTNRAGGNGSIVKQASDTIIWDKGGFDFTGVTKAGNEMRFPAGALSTIHAGPQYFAVLFYARLPSAADWNSHGFPMPMFCCTSVSNGYQGEADMLNIMQINDNSIQFRRQTNGGATTTLNGIAMDATTFGKVCQVYFARTAGGTYVGVRPLGGTAKTASAASGANNSGDFSNKIARFGVPGSWNGLDGAALSTEHAKAAKWKAYDCTILDLGGGLDPMALDGAGKNLFQRDHDRVVALIAASAAANSGISQIYN